MLRPDARRAGGASRSGSARRARRRARRGEARPGRLTSARARATRWRWPPESTAGQSRARSASPTSASAASAAARQPGVRAMPTLPSTRCQGSRRASWKRSRTSRCSASTFWPAMATSPRVGRSSPAIRRSSVDLPPPERPTTARNWPAGTVRSRPRAPAARRTPWQRRRASPADRRLGGGDASARCRNGSGRITTRSGSMPRSRVSHACGGRHFLVISVLPCCCRLVGGMPGEGPRLRCAG